MYMCGPDFQLKTEPPTLSSYYDIFKTQYSLMLSQLRENILFLILPRHLLHNQSKFHAVITDCTKTRLFYNGIGRVLCLEVGEGCVSRYRGAVISRHACISLETLGGVDLILYLLALIEVLIVIGYLFYSYRILIRSLYY